MLFISDTNRLAVERVMDYYYLGEFHRSCHFFRIERLNLFTVIAFLSISFVTFPFQRSCWGFLELFNTK